MSSFFPEIERVSPMEYEQAVKDMLDSQADEPGSYQSRLIRIVDGSDGEYVIEVTAAFSILGFDYMMLVECKRHRRKVDRFDLKVLQQKLKSTGAHKGVVFSTSGFQEDALEFAKAQDIATIQFSERTETNLKGMESSGQQSSALQGNFPKYVGIWIGEDRYTTISAAPPDAVRSAPR